GPEGRTAQQKHPPAPGAVRATPAAGGKKKPPPAATRAARFRSKSSNTASLLRARRIARSAPWPSRSPARIAPDISSSASLRRGRSHDQQAQDESDADLAGALRHLHPQKH